MNGGRFVEGSLLKPFCKGNTSVPVQMDDGEIDVVEPERIFKVGITPVKNDVVIGYHKKGRSAKYKKYAIMGM